VKITQTLVTDDLDGTPDAETRTFAFNGKTYEIDLSENNTAKLQKALTPFLDAGRPLRSNGKPYTGTSRRRNTPADTGGATPSEIRQWWADNPVHLPTWQAKGSIPELVKQAYAERGTQPAPEPEAPAPKQRRTRKPKPETAAAPA
jgi:hypothetical protein